MMKVKKKWRRCNLEKAIIIQGAKEHNLKNLSLSIPKDVLVVLTGPSGSGKSTLAMDTLFKESSRQFLESIGMQGINKPKVDLIRNLSPSISVNQQAVNRNPRSTVGTVTDMYTSLRMIFEKLGERDCPFCEKEIPPHIQEELEKGENSFKVFIHCPHCHHRVEKLTRTHFSYNTTEGACPTCKGLGEVVSIHEESVFHPELSLENGAVDFWKGAYADYQVQVVKEAMKYYGVPICDHLSLQEYSPEQKTILYYGVESDEIKSYFPDVKPPKTVSKGRFEGVLTGMWRRFSEKSGKSTEAEVYFYSKECHECQGKRLNFISRNVTVAGKTIPELVNQSLEKMFEWLREMEKSLDEDSYLITETFIQDMKTKLNRIIKIGLGYLTLDRQTISLSGGEAQRIRLASVLDSTLTGVLYILDEPTAGLHPKDTAGLVHVIKELRDLGNTVVVIEHDVDVMREADYIIDMGQGSGTLGGTVVGEGTLAQLMEQEASITGKYLRMEQELKSDFREAKGEIVVHNATIHNLKNVSVSFPVGCLTAVTGVSGSGKSSLVFDVLANGLDKFPIGFDRVSGLELFDQVVTVGQSPLTRMKRSNVATYTDVFTHIRKVFAGSEEAREKGLSSNHFSFNTKGGRCENCEGLGYVITNMLFFPDLEVPCPVCRGKRFQPEVLSIKYNGYSINDVLESSIQDCVDVFKEEDKIQSILHLLVEIGLGYLHMGQSLTTLSGGEGQRLKLATELMKKRNKQTLYLLDEPTTGLHPVDVQQLTKLLNRLVDAGNTVIIVEHNSQLIGESDWMIDLGPEGGDKGGTVVAEGTPVDVTKNKDSITGRYL